MSLLRLALLVPLLSRAASAGEPPARGTVPAPNIPRAGSASLCWGIRTGDELALRGTHPISRPGGRLPVRGARWVDNQGRTLTQTFPVPIDLLTAPLWAPAGTWAEVELILDLDLPTLSVVLDEPAGGVNLWLDLDSEALLGLDADDTARVLEDTARMVLWP